MWSETHAYYMEFILQAHIIEYFSNRISVVQYAFSEYNILMGISVCLGRCLATYKVHNAISFVEIGMK